MTYGNEQIRNNAARDQWRHKACPGALERYSEARNAVLLVWRSEGPPHWKANELCKIKQTVPAEAVFEIDLLISMLEGGL